MLSSFISLGDKIELQAVQRVHYNDDAEEKRRTYNSMVHEILTEDTLEITMPMEQTKLILLPVDGEYDMIFYGETGLYQCFARIADRYKTNNVYILRVELISNLRKYQRREYYRFSCALEMCSRTLEEEEVQTMDDKAHLILQPGLPLRRSMIADISGGGLRFIADQKYEPGSLIYCNYNLVQDIGSKTYEVIGKVLAVQELENRPGEYEHRVQYHNMDVNTREEIIKFIFEEERRTRKKERS